MSEKSVRFLIAQQLLALFLRGKALFLGFFLLSVPPIYAVSVSPDVVTETPAHSAVDVAIWENKGDPSKSVVFSSDRRVDGGFFARSLSGKLLQHFPLGLNMNQIDVRYGFTLDGQEVDILAGNTDEYLVLFRINPNYTIDPDTGLSDDLLVLIADDASSNNSQFLGNNFLQVGSNGFTLYKHADGTFYVFDHANTGGPDRLRQYILEDDGEAGEGIKLTEIRTLNYPSGSVQGLFADDIHNHLYLARQHGDIYQFDADPANNNDDPLFTVTPQGGPGDMRTGLSFYGCDSGPDYLLVSNFAQNKLEVYQRLDSGLQYIKDIVPLTDTGEADVKPLGTFVYPEELPGFSSGMLVVADNSHGHFGYYNWEDAAENDLFICGAPPPNAPPIITINEPLNRTITLPDTLSVTGSIQDDNLPNPPAQVTTTWSKVSGPGNVQFTPGNNVNTTVTFAQAGNFEIQVMANDGAASTTTIINVTVNPEPNQPPVIQNLSANPNPVTLPNTVILNATVTDDQVPPSGPITYTWTVESAPSGSSVVTFSPPNSVPTTASFSEAGDYTISLTASDGDQTSLPTSILITVNPQVNEPPVITNLTANPNPVTLPDTVTLNATVTDDQVPPSGPITYTWTVESAPSGNSVVTFSPPAGLPTTATFSEAGDYTISLTASDGDKTSDPLSIPITVNPQINQPPIINSVTASPDTLLYPANISNLSVSASDDGVAPGGPLVYTWSVVTKPLIATVNFTPDEFGASVNATMSHPGGYVFNINVSDGDKSADQTVSVTINAPNNSVPEVEAGSDQLITLPDNDVNLDGSVTDDGFPLPPNLIKTWEKVSGPGNVSFSPNNNDPEATATFSESGIYVLRLIGDDGQLSASDEMTVVVNAPPVVSAGQDINNALVDTPIQLDGSVTDDGLPQPASLTQVWTKVSGPGTVTFLPNSNLEKPTATFSFPGEYVLRLEGDDSEKKIRDTVRVTVVTPAPGNQAPVVDAGQDRTITLPTNVVALDATVTDDGLPDPPKNVTFQWRLVSGPTSVSFINDQAEDTSVFFNAAGIYVLELTASDQNLQASDRVTITVNAAQGSAPGGGTNIRFSKTALYPDEGDILTMEIPIASPSSVSVRIKYRGFLVKNLFDGFSSGPTLQLTWDMRDNSGVLVNTKILTVEWEQNGNIHTERIAVVRGKR